MSSRSTAKKTLQSFHARTTLWKLFELRAEEMECSVDYLINEAMRLYATSHEFLSDEDIMRQTKASPTAASQPGTPQATQPVVPRGGSAPLPRPGGARQPSAVASTPPPLPRPTGVASSQSSLPPQAAGMSPPGTGSSESMGQQYPTLTLIFQGNKIPIQGGQFIIGRGAKASDLAIKDANISRKHAAVIYHNGAYYLKDLGSTNGIEYKGQQVDSKRIDEGDVFSICGYEMHFTYNV